MYSFIFMILDCWAHLSLNNEQKGDLRHDSISTISNSPPNVCICSLPDVFHLASLEMDVCLTRRYTNLQTCKRTVQHPGTIHQNRPTRNQRAQVQTEEGQS